MSKTKSQYQTDMLNDALNHLDPDAVGFRGSDAVEHALRDPALRNYLLSWVLPQLVALRDGDVPKWMRATARGVQSYERRG